MVIAIYIYLFFVSRLDHTRILGSTVEEIGLEKAGIMKPQIPVVVGPRVPHKVLQVRKTNMCVFFLFKLSPSSYIYLLKHL